MFDKLVRDIFRTQHFGHNFEQLMKMAETLDYLPVLFALDRAVCTGCEIENCEVG